MRYSAVPKTSWRRTLLLPALGMALGVAICLLVAGITTAWLLSPRDPLAANPEGPADLAVAVQSLQIRQVVPDAGVRPHPRRPPDIDGPKRPEPMADGDALDLQRVSGRDSLAVSAIGARASLARRFETPAAETPAVETEDGAKANVEAETPAAAAPLADAGASPAPVLDAPTPERTRWKPNDGGQHVAESAYGALLEPKGEACGTDVCARGQSCCNPSCGTCVPPGATCSQLSCSMPRYPVSMPCGLNTCSVGQVCCNFSCGICALPGASCSDQLCD